MNEISTFDRYQFEHEETIYTLPEAIKKVQQDKKERKFSAKPYVATKEDLQLIKSPLSLLNPFVIVGSIILIVNIIVFLLTQSTTATLFANMPLAFPCLMLFFFFRLFCSSKGYEEKNNII